MIGIYISDVQSLPPELARALLAELERQVQGQETPPATPASPPPLGSSPLSEPLFEWSETEARAFYDRLRSLKSMNALSAVIKNANSAMAQKAVGDQAGGKVGFSLKIVEKAMGTDDLGGVWGGFTKSSQSVSGSTTGRLITWRPVRDKYGKQIDSIGLLAEATWNALRNVLLIASEP